MKKSAKVKIPAKINLTLDITGKNGAYHDIRSLVASIEIFDAITLYKRKDDKVTLTEKGLSANCDESDNNAVKCYKLLQKEYSLSGADIVIDKDIPVGAGLGGSSADIAGVILATEKLFGIKIDRKKTASALGSDVLYMIEGGFAVISGRGNDVEKLPVDKTLYVNVIDNRCPVKAGESYALFDKTDTAVIDKKTFVTDLAVEKLFNGDKEFFSLLKNDLQKPSETLAPIIKETAGRFTNANASLMTGSGSAVIGVYEKKEDRDKDYKSLKSIFSDRLIKTQTLNK